MAKKNTKIQKQLEEGLQNANQVVDQQIEGKAAPKPAPAAPPTPPAAAAPSAPAAGGTSVPPQQQAPTPELQFEAEIAKIIKGNQYFVNEFRKIRDGVIRGDDAMGLNDKLQRLSKAIAGASGNQIPAKAIEGFLTEKVQAQASPAVRQEVTAQEAAPTQPAQGAESPVSGQGVVDTLPAPVSTPSVAPTGLSVDPMAPAGTPETQVTATTPDQSGLTPEELAMLQAADEQVAGQREQIEPQKDPAFRISDYFTPEEVAQMKAEGRDPYQEILDIRAFGSKQSSGISVAPSQETSERSQRQRLMETADSEPKWVKKKKLASIQEARREVMEFASLNPIDDLYLLFDRMFGANGIRPFEARNSMLDPESYTRGSTAMRMSLFHFALGYLPKDMAENPQIKKLREQFDAIMRELGVEQDLIDQARSPMATRDRRDFDKNARLQRVAIDDIIRIVEKLKDGGALRRPDVAPALHVLTKLIGDMDSDFVTDSYIKFDPRNEYGEKLQTQVDNLELVTESLVERIRELTGEDLRKISTGKGDIARPGWSPLRANGATFTTQNAIRYETGSRRRYALDKAGVIDPRWQEVDAQGLDVPSFINPMHPEPDTTKAAIGFILTTDPTADLHYAAGGRGRRDTMRESAIIKAVKDYLSETDYNDTSSTWDSDLTLPGDIGVGDNIEYTLDSSVIDSEVARRRSLLPTDRIVIVRLDPKKFPIGSVIQDSRGNVRGILNHHGIMVLPEGHPLIEQAVINGAKITKPFALGSVVDTSAIVDEGEFGQLLIDVDPHVFPAVKHTLPLRDPMGRKGTVAMIPVSFAETVDPVRITVRDRDGMPSRILVPQLDENGNLIYTDTGTQKTFSQSGAEGKHKTGKDFGIADVLPGDVTTFAYDGRPVLRVRDVDVSASSQDWPDGIAAAIVADSDGNFPNLGTLADRYLADQDEFDVRRRWVFGDMLGAEQGVDRPGRVAYGDELYGLMHGSVTDAEMERGLAIMREQDAAIEAGTPKRDMQPLTPEEDELVRKVRGRLTTNRKFSPARSPYDADEVFASSEDEWAVSQREKVDRRTSIPETPDPFIADVEAGAGVSYEPLTAEVASDIRMLKAKLIYLLAMRSTRANFDAMNSRNGERSVGDIVGFAPEIAAIRQELARVGVTRAAVDTFIANVGDRMPALDAEQKRLLQSEIAQPMIVTLEPVMPVSSLPGLSVSSRAFGTTGRQFLTPEQAGVAGSLDRLDKIAYTIAAEMAARDQASRIEGAPYLSLDAMLQEQAAKEEVADEFAGFDDQPGAGGEEDLASLMQETPAETRTRRLRPSARSKGFSGITTTEELRTVARKAYTIFSLFQARDDAGDGWVKFMNNFLYADNMAGIIADEWRNSGEAAIFVDNRLFATKAGEIPQLTASDGKRIGFLSKQFVKALERNTDYGSELIKFATDNDLDFVLIKEVLRDDSGRVIPGQYTDQVFLVKVKKDKSGKKVLDFADLSDMSSKYGYQPLADDTSFTRTEERVRTVLKENGSDSLFDVVPTTDRSGRYVLSLRPEALIEFGLFDGDPAKAKEWVERAENRSGVMTDNQIRQYRIMLDTRTKYNFYQEMNALAVRIGVEAPFPEITMASVFDEVSKIYDDGGGMTITGETSGPFGMRKAINQKNPHVPGENVVPRVISERPVPKAEEDWVRYLATGDTEYAPGVDPMLDAALETNSIRDELTKKIIKEGRGGAPESATGRRVETETTRAMFRRAIALKRAGKLNSILRSNAGQGIAGGALSLALLAGANQLNEENAKTALAFEALGAVSPGAAAVASLGFTGMNKGDMLRTLINIIGGFGGAAVGTAAGTATLPVAGSFVGGMAGSVAGSTIADNIYSQLVGTEGGKQYVPDNMATVTQPAMPEEKDPFSVFKGLGG